LEVIDDFPQGVRQLLIDASDPLELQSTLKRISVLVDSHWGLCRTLSPATCDLGLPAEVGGHSPPLFEPFARVRLQVLRRLGGRFGAEAKRLAARLEDTLAPEHTNLLLVAEAKQAQDALLDEYVQRFGRTWMPSPWLDDVVTIPGGCWIRMWCSAAWL